MSTATLSSFAYSAPQTAQILHYLRTRNTDTGQRNTLTQLEALVLFRCFRLASRIHDLKNAGFHIARVMERGTDGTRYARYRLLD